MVVFSGPGFCHALHGQLWEENQFTFSSWWSWFWYSFCFIKRLLRAQDWRHWRTQLRVVKTGHTQHTTTSDLVLYVNVWFLLTYFKLSNSIPFLNWSVKFLFMLVAVRSVKWFFLFAASYLYVNYVSGFVWYGKEKLCLFYQDIWTEFSAYHRDHQ